MSELTEEGLLSFINNQPADKEINHASWRHCAVGDYVASVLGEFDRRYDLDSHVLSYQELQVDFLSGNLGSTLEGILCAVEAETYGDAQLFLSNPELLEAELAAVMYDH